MIKDKEDMLFSVVVPVFNSGPTIERIKTQVFNGIGPFGEAELIFVDDGSTDDSWEKIEFLANESDGKIRGIKLSKNYGQHNATLCGLKEAKGDFIITLDDDLQFSPDQIPFLIRKAKESGSELVYGIGEKDRRNFFRAYGGKFFKWIFKELGYGFESGSSFKLISKKLNKKLSSFPGDVVFLDQILSWYTDKVEFVEVKHDKREAGTSGYSFWALVRLAFRMILNFSDIPLKLMVLFGFILAFLTLVTGTVFIGRKMLIGAPVGFTAIIVSIFFSTSLILVCIGVIGVYISRIYSQRISKPAYSIDQLV
jgi:polyisoprenyl-phosphate glycosyltransferase